MHTSSVRLCGQDVLEHARNIIRPAGWQCEWNIASLNKPVICRIMLTSWNAYFKHLEGHCHEYSHENKTNSYPCRLPRCTMPRGVSITSYTDLVNHLQTSHLNRAALHCPVKGCNSPSFSRPAVLEAHYVEIHPELLGQTVNLPSEFLLPSWRPFYPVPTKLAPIPTHISPGSILIPPVQGSWNARPPTPRRLSGGKAKYGSPKKPAKMDVTSSAKEKQDDTQESEEFDFDDLPQQLDDSKNYIQESDMESVIREIGPYLDVSRPQPLLDPTIFRHRVLPDTILYNAWVRQNQDTLDKESDEEDGDDDEAGGADNVASVSSGVAPLMDISDA